MKTITIKGITLQFEAESDSSESIRESVELINLALQREPYGLNAQISTAGKVQISSEDLPDA